MEHHYDTLLLAYLGVLPESVGEDKKADVVADVVTIGQFASTPDDGHHRLHPDSSTPLEQDKEAPLSNSSWQCQCKDQCHHASPTAPEPHTPSNSRQKQSLTTPTQLDLQSRDKSCS